MDDIDTEPDSELMFSFLKAGRASDNLLHPSSLDELSFTELIDTRLNFPTKVDRFSFLWFLISGRALDKKLLLKTCSKIPPTRSSLPFMFRMVGEDVIFAGFCIIFPAKNVL